MGPAEPPAASKERFQGSFSHGPCLQGSCWKDLSSSLNDVPSRLPPQLVTNFVLNFALRLEHIENGDAAYKENKTYTAPPRLSTTFSDIR